MRTANPNLQGLNKRGWVDVLPYFDQAPLYNSADHNGAFGSYNRAGTVPMAGDPFNNGNARIVSTILPIMICPSDDGDPLYRGSSVNYQISTLAFQNGLFGAKTSYDFSVRRYSNSASLWSSEDRLTRRLTAFAQARMGGEEAPALTQARHRQQLLRCRAALATFLGSPMEEFELRAEDLRRAAQALGRITGVIDPEEVLGEIFGRFCIGK